MVTIWPSVCKSTQDMHGYVARILLRTTFKNGVLKGLRLVSSHTHQWIQPTGYKTGIHVYNSLSKQKKRWDTLKGSYNSAVKRLLNINNTTSHSLEILKHAWPIKCSHFLAMTLNCKISHLKTKLRIYFNLQLKCNSIKVQFSRYKVVLLSWKCKLILKRRKSESLNQLYTFWSLSNISNPVLRNNSLI